MAQVDKGKYTLKALEKSPTGISGFDDITYGGLPKGRPALVCGGAGSGKTLFGMEFIVRGATEFNEPGVFVTFEENDKDLRANFASMGFDLKKLEHQKKVVLDHIFVERSEIEMTGEYDLEGLFVRLGYLVDSIGAKRIVLDTLEALFALPNENILRAEMRRLFRWLKEKGLTAVITAEQGKGNLTRHGIEEYISDCVVFLDHRVIDQIATRRIRILKYRGSLHGTNEYPFLISSTGLSVLPITTLELKYGVSKERVSSGIPALDSMLAGKGFYRGSNVLVTGTAGTGKTSLSATFANSLCNSGQKCLYLAFEESDSQIVRNMSSIGIDLKKHVDKGLLRFHATRPTIYGLEMHLVKIHDMVNEFKPAGVIFDPVSNLMSIGTETEVKSMLTRLVDYMKGQGITAYFTSLTHPERLERSEQEISSLMDTWILVRDIEYSGERTRGLYILKSRGMAHSNQIREFQISKNGIELFTPYIGPGLVLTGSARKSQEAKERADKISREQEIERKQRDIERKRAALKARIEELKAEFDSEKEEFQKVIDQDKLREEMLEEDKALMARMRKAEMKQKNGPKQKALVKGNK